MMARKLSTQIYDKFTGIFTSASTSEKIMTANVDSETNEFKCLTCVATCPDPEEFESSVFNLTDSLGYLLSEEYVYFNVIKGELKIREPRPNVNKDGELIAYKRIETPHEKIYLAEGSLTYVQDVDFLKNTLNVSLSEIGKLRIKRRVFEKDNVRINFDVMENIGIYTEIDVRISALEPEESDFELMNKILAELNVKSAQLMPCSYLDLYRKMKSSDSGLDDESNQSDC